MFIFHQVVVKHKKKKIVQRTRGKCENNYKTDIVLKHLKRVAVSNCTVE
jgi:hypothetical protein